MRQETAGPDSGARRPALARERQTQILARVREQGAVRIADLVRALGVSDMTVRRDLGLLQERGLIEKVHGGAAAIEGSPAFEPGFSVKSTLMQAEKTAIAAAAASLVAPGTAIAISAGTTTFALARRLTNVPDLTVLTNSVPVADVLYRDGRPDQTVILSGGVRTPSDALVGPFAVDVIRSLHVDSVFMGTHGMNPKSGFTTPNILESETNRAFIEAGRHLMVLADNTKWGIVGISSFARLEDAEMIITDSGLDPAARQQLASAALRLMMVDVATGEVRTIDGGWRAGGPSSQGAISERDAGRDLTETPLLTQPCLRRGRGRSKANRLHSSCDRAVRDPPGGAGLAKD